MVDQCKVNDAIEIPSSRASSIQRKFVPDQTLKPKILSDSADLLEVKGFIKEFKNYIQSGYGLGEEVPAGYYRHMRNILEQSWIDRLDRKEADKQDLNGLCKLLHEEAERKYPKHQRRINMMKMKKFQSESCSEFLRRIRKNLEVAEIATMSAEELGIHVFIEGVDQVITKLAMDELQKPSPSIDDLETAVQNTEVSVWYGQETKKGYGKLATTRQGSKHCTKCDRPGHLQEDCWGSCKWCKKTNHPSDRCFNKPKEDSNAEKANKTKKKPNKKKKKAKKASMPALVDEEELEDEDSDSEEPSPTKPQTKRIARAELEKGAIPKRSLTERINEMDPEQPEDFA